MHSHYIALPTKVMHYGLQPQLSEIDWTLHQNLSGYETA